MGYTVRTWMTMTLTIAMALVIVLDRSALQLFRSSSVLLPFARDSHSFPFD